MIIGADALAEDGEKLRERLRDKLEDIGSFLSGARIMVELESEELAGEAVDLIVSMLSEHSDMTLQAVRCRGVGSDGGKDVSTDIRMGQGARESVPAGPADWVDFHLSTVRGGQSIHSPRSLVVMGSVNPGGSVTAVGNIYVLGSLGGVAHAGYAGDDETWIYAWKMNPLQLRIGEHLARSAQDEEGEVPECAVVDEGRICVYPADHLEELAARQARRHAGNHLNVAKNDT